jgi:hypothetical protein
VVPPPTPTPTLTPFGEGNALIACFVREPVEPGRAGYKVNVNPLPASGSVEVNLTLLRTDGLFEYKTVTLPPGTPSDLEFYGAYETVWANLVYRNDNGDIYAVVNLKGECTVAPGPTFTPTLTPVSTATSTIAPSGTPTSSPTFTPTGTSTVSPVVTPTSTGSPPETPTSTPESSGTVTPTRSPTPTDVLPSETAVDPKNLPNTGKGPKGQGGPTPFLVIGAILTALALGLGLGRERGRRGS